MFSGLVKLDSFVYFTWNFCVKPGRQDHMFCFIKQRAITVTVWIKIWKIGGDMGATRAKIRLLMLLMIIVFLVNGYNSHQKSVHLKIWSTVFCMQHQNFA